MRRRVTREINRLASLPTEVFEEIVRYVLGIFTGRLRQYGELFFHFGMPGAMYRTVLTGRYANRTIRVFGRNLINAPYLR